MKLPASEWGAGCSGRGRAARARVSALLRGSQVGRRGCSVGSKGPLTYTFRKRDPGVDEAPPQGCAFMCSAPTYPGPLSPRRLAEMQ